MRFASRRALHLAATGLLAVSCVTIPEGSDSEEGDALEEGLTIDPSAVYTIVGVQSNKCVEIRGGSTAASTAAQIAACNGTTRQQFRVESAGSGYFRLRNVNSNLCLGASGGATANGTAIVQASCDSSRSQQFSFVDLPGGTQRVTIRSSGKALDVTGRATADGTALQQYSWSNTDNQKFSFRVVSGTGTGSTSSSSSSTSTSTSTSTSSGTGGAGGAGGTGGAGGSGGSGGAGGSGGSTPADGTVGVAPAAGCGLGYSQLPNGRGGYNVEAVCIPTEVRFDMARSLEAFKTTVYPILQDNCSGCHSTSGKGQAPIHADANAELAHEYALTRVNFKKPADSKLVVRMGIDRHNCFGRDCRDANTQMLAAVERWAAAVAPTLPATPRPVPAGETVTEDQVKSWIATNKATVPAADAEFIKYASLHELHNRGATAEELNVARVGLSKALNSTARWAPVIVNPVDINGKGIVYRFDTRDYWGYNKGVTKLHFGGSDDDVFFGRTTVNYLGEPVGSDVTFRERYRYASSVSRDPNFAKLVWGRVVAGNVEGATDSAVLPPNVNGFKPEYIEASQLVYTLTRPDVYNSIMAIPWYANDLENELGVIKDAGMKSFEYMVTKQAITVDSRMYWRARTRSGGYYWKTWDVFTGQLDGDVRTIEEAYEQGQIRFPFWAYPIPKFINGTGGGVTASSYSFIATLAQPNGTEPAGCEGQPSYGGSGFLNCRYYTGTDGLQQSAEEVIWDLPNGLQGYSLWGGFNQRRVDAFVNIVRDPRIARTATDQQINSLVGFASPDRRLNVGSSCIGCHADGMNRGNNDIRDWLDAGGERLPKGAHGVDRWINDTAAVAQVKELYPPSTVMRPRMEDDRRVFLAAMARIKQGMILGPDKNVYVEPTIWTIEWAQNFYRYPASRSN
ncbi:RICIN domain-containing protein [Sorangium sp. So ce131]|uniref:RICIN domain-containing protein n=1 Tax=Sorangium sp. So ce131 TaxID=3133282 RepID=UPI003F5E82BF